MAERILYTAGVVAVAWAVTFALRSLPFLLFAGRGRDVPPSIERFGTVVSPVIIAGLVIYSYSGLEWRTAWPYLAGLVTVGLQIWKGNPLASIMAGTVLYMCLLNAGCASGPREIVLDAAHPSIRYSVNGFLLGDKFIDPAKLPRILENYEVPHDRVIHILVDEEAERNLRPARIVMGMLAHSGYRRSVLVSKKRAESRVRTGEEIVRERVRRPPTRGNGPGKIRYKGANE